MATNYEKGRRFEYYVKKKYEDDGCFVVRAAGSKGPVDLIIIRPNGWIWFVQCKKRFYISPKQKQELVACAKKFKAFAVLIGKKRNMVEICPLS